MELQLFNYNGNNVSFRKENENIYLNATEMAKPFSKRTNDWLSLKQTKDLIDSLSVKTGIPAMDLTIVNNGGSNPGTWLYEDLALIFAQWLKSDFYLWCNDRIKELMKFGITATPETLNKLINNPDLIINLATALKSEREENKLLTERNNAQIFELKKQAPKVAYFNEVLQSESTYITNQIAKELGTSAISLNKFLSDKKIQYKQNGTWLLYHIHQNKGYTKTTTFSKTDENGITKTYMNTVWTEKGRLFIHSVFKSQKINSIDNQ